MLITKELEWVREFVELAEHLLPKIKQVKKISGKKANPNRGQHFVGIIIYYDKKSFRICLYTTYKDRNTSEVGPYYTIDILGTLAHELAHLAYWEHSPDHKKLECAIMDAFMSKLKKDGYISEEEEAKNGLFYHR